MQTTVDIPVSRVKRAAKKNCEKCLIIGVDKHGEEYFASSMADSREALWLAQRFIHKLLNGDFNEP